MVYFWHVTSELFQLIREPGVLSSCSKSSFAARINLRRLTLDCRQLGQDILNSLGIEHTVTTQLSWTLVSTEVLVETAVAYLNAPRKYS